MKRSEKNVVAVNKNAQIYSVIKPKYDKLGLNLIQALEIFLKENSINFLSINYRVKADDSFLEKVERKKYEHPFEEIEDFCGIRIICYYQSEVAQICEIINKEFDVIDNQDKEDLLQMDQFGYRSTHFIVRISSKWLEAPNYRGLENLKAEIQIRTVLMHAWAEIEHKLSYKSESQIPKQFKRKLFRISAKLEEADEQFEEMKNSITDYKNEVIAITKNLALDSDVNELDLNLDSLQAFLDSEFPERRKNTADTAALVDEFTKKKITLKDFIDAYKLVKPHIEEIEKEEFETGQLRVKVANGIYLSQVGVARTIMDLTREDFREGRGLPEAILEVDRKWSKLLLGKAKK